MNHHEAVPKPRAAAHVKERLQEELASSLAEALYIDRKDVNAESEFVELGLDSVVGVEWIRVINKQYGLSLPVTKVYDYPSIERFAEFLCKQLNGSSAAVPSISAQIPSEPSPREVPVAARVDKGSIGAAESLSRASRHRRWSRARSRSCQQADVSIAIVGMSGRYPGAENVAAYWTNLRSAVNSVKPLPADHWERRGSPNQRALSTAGIYCRSMGVLSDIDAFDPLFFKIAPSEAELIDPQQRLFLQEGYRAFEDAGYGRDALSDRKCGVYLGIMSNEYALILHRDGRQAMSTTGNSYAIAAARLAYHLNLKGPAIAVDTACSSSLVATHLACQALKNHEIDMALAGGVTLYLAPESYRGMCEAGMLSATGQCKAFDNSADGFVPGEGVGAIVLKRLSDAERDGDHIYGVVIGSGTNQDGKTKGITAPSVNSQMALAREIYAKHAIDPATITYVELHGTGTKLGDPIELEALATVFAEQTDKRNFCAIGSVKTNIGHTSAAAGVAGIHKVLLSMRHGALAPSLHFQTPNEHFDFHRSPFYVNTELKPWVTENGQTRRAGVSSFGFSGTNAHLVIEEYPTRRDAHQNSLDVPVVIPLSAQTPEQRKEYARQMRQFVEGSVDLDLAALAYTLQVGRLAMTWRLAIVAQSKAELAAALAAHADSLPASNVFLGEAPESGRATGPIESDEDVELLLGSWMQQKNPHKIAAAWARGVNVKWDDMYPGGAPGRISAPTYPFAQERYWLPAIAAAGGREPDGAAGTIHPLAQTNTSTLAEFRFTSRLTRDNCLLADHVVGGSVVLSAAAQLEMARAAAAWLLREDALAPDAIELSDISWTRPVVVDGDALEIHVGLRPEEDGLSYRIYGAPDSVYSHGRARAARRESPGQRIDLPRLQSECGARNLEAMHCYAAFRAAGLDYGPAYRAIGRLSTGKGGVLAELSLPEAIGDGQGAYVLHPSLADAALQSCIGLANSLPGSKTALPFAVERLKIYAPLPAKCWAHARYAEGSGPDARLPRIDVDVFDAAGKLCVDLDGLVVKEASDRSHLTRSVGQEPGALLFIRQSKESVGGATQHDHHIVFPCEVALELQAALEAGGSPWRCLPLNARSLHIGDRFQAYAKQLATALKSSGKTGTTTLCQLLIPDTEEQYVLRGLGGLLRTAQRENPALRGQVICLPERCSIERTREILLESSADPNEEISYRGGVRWAAEWQAVERPSGGADPSKVWRDGGVYLITGGAGALGLIFAAEIARHADAAKIVLAGRSALPSSVEERIARIKGRNARLEYVRTDVASAAAAARLVAYVERSHGPLNGVIHAAGVVKDNFLVNKSDAEFDEVMAPKVLGTVALDEATKGSPLDLFVLFSSVAAALGNVGQADYATGNAFMDAYACYRAGLAAKRERSGKTLSINWPLWRAGGMAVDERIRELAARQSGAGLLGSAEGLQAFYDAYAVGGVQAMVLAGDPARLRDALARERAAPSCVPRNAAARIDDESGLNARVVARLRAAVSKVLKAPEARIAANASFADFGVDSINVLQLTSELETTFGPLPKTLLFEYQTIDQLAGHFIAAFGERLAELMGVPSAGGDLGGRASEAVPAADASMETGAEIARSSWRRSDRVPSGRSTADKPDAIAVIGLAGRYPGARDVAEFWCNLRDGVDSITEIPANRWDYRRFFDPDKTKVGTVYSKWGGFIDGVAEFDPRFFNISPKEAHYMDPQERLFLQCAHAAIEDAGYTRDALARLAGQGMEGNVGVFVGVMYSEYQLFGAEETARGNAISLPGNPSSIANRVSYYFNLHGPSMAIDTMCSASLTALHLAMQSLESGECEMALAGGVNLSLHPNKYLGLCQGKFVSSTGRCESFGQGGDGYVPGEGVGAVLLKPLARAKADGDHIYGVIKGTAINHGGRTHGYSVPNPQAQTSVIQRALQRAGVNPRTVSYVEAHGTGTSLGDPIEIAGLQKGFDEFTQDKGFCALGSLKSNIGHCESAAGIAGLTKILLQLKHQQLVPSLHSQTLNPNIEFTATPFVVQQALADWKPPEVTLNGERCIYPRTAMLSSFGAGGSNAHVIVEEFTDGEREPRPAAIEERQAVLLSARSEAGLKECVQRLLDRLDAGELSTVELRDIAFTLQIGREHRSERLGFVVDSHAALARALRGFLGSDAETSGSWRGKAEQPDGRTEIAVDGGMQTAIDAGIAKGETEKLVELWVSGVRVDWQQLHRRRPPRKVSLPTYPFARETYWVPERDQSNDRKLAAAPADHAMEGISLQSLRAVEAGRRIAPAPVREVESGRITLVPMSGRSPLVATSAGPAQPPAHTLNIPIHAPDPGSRAGGGGVGIAAASIEQLEGELMVSLAHALFLDPGEIDPKVGFTDIGLDSVVGVEWVQSINKQYRVNITATKVYDYPNVREFAVYLADVLRRNGTEGTAGLQSRILLDELLEQVQAGTMDVYRANQLLARLAAGEPVPTS